MLLIHPKEMDRCNCQHFAWLPFIQGLPIACSQGKCLYTSWILHKYDKSKHSRDALIWRTIFPPQVLKPPHSSGNFLDNEFVVQIWDHSELYNRLIHWEILVVFVCLPWQKGQRLYQLCGPSSPSEQWKGISLRAGAADGPRGTSCCSHKACPPLIMLLP